jgi:phosphoenolpyruvate carboxykinase (ATP)
MNGNGNIEQDAKKTQAEKLIEEYQNLDKPSSTRSMKSCSSEDDLGASNHDLRRTLDEGVQCRVKDKKSLIKLQRKKRSKEEFESMDNESAERILQSLSKSLKSQARNEGPKITMDEYELDRVPFNVKKGPTDHELKFTKVVYNPSACQLYEDALQYESEWTSIVSSGALAALSGAKTGRCPKDKRIVWENDSKDDIWWAQGEESASPNVGMDERSFALNRETAVDYLKSLSHVYVVDGYAGWDKEHRIKVRCICAKPYHALFITNMIVQPTKQEMGEFSDEVDFTIINAGQFPCNRFTGYMTSDTSVDINFKSKEIVILGTQYAGEMKKGIFTVMHYLMPKKNVLSLHSGCNMGDSGVTLFFGLSGTGKTTLSTESGRALIGDDEHCWSDSGVFNIEGGCYAKCIGLSQEREPEIFNAIRFGSVLENVVFDSENRVVDYDDGSITANTRAAYPIEYIPGARLPCVGPHPTNIILLCCDAFGVLPPVSRLTISQALYYFISGYTAKVAGTEVGVTEPEATFSACFGSAFLVMHPLRYASLLAEKMAQHKTNAWLINTGWTGGQYGEGKRIKLKHTRSIVNAIHSGELLTAKYTVLPEFNLNVPASLSNVPDSLLEPRNTWDDKDAYDKKTAFLGDLFNKNFEKVCSSVDISSPALKTLMEEIKSSGPVGHN